VTAALTAFYLLCFQLAAVPAILKVAKLQSSRELSVWREWLLLTGVAVQFVVMLITGASWFVLASPVVSAVSLSTLLAVVYRHR
jgi:hypothetical protein